MRYLKAFILFVFISFFFSSVAFSTEVIKEDNNPLFKGYVTNKAVSPLKLKVFKISDEFFYFSERSLEDNAYIPKVNLELVAENSSDYSEVLDTKVVYIPQGTKFVGYISEIIPPKKFNKQGFYKVNFSKVVCPDEKVINLKDNVVSASQLGSYNPLRHFGKTTLSLLGGTIAGAIFSYELGGLGLALATKGYSLAAGAAAGGFVGTVYGITSSGKHATIEPGNELVVLPVDLISLDKLGQVTCSDVVYKDTEEGKNKNVDVEVLSIKEKKDVFGERLLKLDVRVTNNSNNPFQVNNFFLRDSQGKEYPLTFIDFNTDIFEDFPPSHTKITSLEFFIEHPKASHWLVLKNKTLSKNIGIWKIDN